MLLTSSKITGGNMMNEQKKCEDKSYQSSTAWAVGLGGLVVGLFLYGNSLMNNDMKHDTAIRTKPSIEWTSKDKSFLETRCKNTSRFGSDGELAELCYNNTDNTFVDDYLR